MKELKETVRGLARSARRTLRLSPMHAVLRGLRKRGTDPGTCSAVECFAYTGGMHTLDYAPSVKELELWEINPAHHAVLTRRFPQAVVRTVDTYEEVRRTTRTFDLIVVDNSPYHGGHVEHFDMFPSIFRMVPASAVLILDVLPEMNATVRTKYPEVFRPEALEARRQFYGVEDPAVIPPATIARAYATRAASEGFRVDWHFFRKRNPILTYLVMKISRLVLGLEVAVGELNLELGLLLV